jgi:hypothetical protein
MCAASKPEKPSRREARGRLFAMPLFWKAYKSDVTSFIEEMKAKRPTLEDEQRRGRSLLWDRRIDRTAEQEYDEARVHQQAYVYQTKQT